MTLRTLTLTTQPKKNRKKVERKITRDPLENINSEHKLQKACVYKLKAHNVLCFCTDVFNGMSFIRDIRSKAIYKQHMIAMGSTVGQPDLILLHHNKCTFVEFKWKRGKKSPDQEAVCNKLISMGYEVLEWRTLEDCEKWLLEHLRE